MVVVGNEQPLSSLVDDGVVVVAEVVAGQFSAFHSVRAEAVAFTPLAQRERCGEDGFVEISLPGVAVKKESVVSVYRLHLEGDGRGVGASEVEAMGVAVVGGCGHYDVTMCHFGYLVVAVEACSYVGGVGYLPTLLGSESHGVEEGMEHRRG